MSNFDWSKINKLSLSNIFDDGVDEYGNLLGRSEVINKWEEKYAEKTIDFLNWVNDTILDNRAKLVTGEEVFGICNRTFGVHENVVSRCGAALTVKDKDNIPIYIVGLSVKDFTHALPFTCYMLTYDKY